MTPPPALPPLTPPPARRRNRRWLTRGLVLSTLFVAILVGWKFMLPLLGGSRGDRPLTATAVRGELRVTITDRGELESINAVVVSCELQGGGKLVTIIDEGKRVKKGDEVARLDTDKLVGDFNTQDVKWRSATGKASAARNNLTQTKYKAETEIAKADLEKTLAGYKLEAYDDPKGEYVKELEDKRGVLELNRKQLKEAEEDLQFTRGMVKDGYVPLPQLKPKELNVQQRRFEVNSAEADVVILEKFGRKQKLAELDAKAKETAREHQRTIESQKAAVEKAAAELEAEDRTAEIEKKQLDRLKEQIDRCTILAPSDGIVVYMNSRYWDESSRIRPGVQLYYRQEIFSLPDLSQMKVKMKIHESVIKKVSVGMKATLQIDALGSRLLTGKVVKIATIAQADGWRGAGVKQYETEVSIDDMPSDAGLKPGMTAEVKILVGTIPDAISVPVAAVTEYDGKKVVYAVSGSTVTRREVTVGDSNEQFVQILDGLAAGEDVALDARTRAATELKQAGKDTPEAK